MKKTKKILSVLGMGLLLLSAVSFVSCSGIAGKVKDSIDDALSDLDNDNNSDDDDDDDDDSLNTDYQLPEEFSITIKTEYDDQTDISSFLVTKKAYMYEGKIIYFYNDVDAAFFNYDDNTGKVELESVLASDTYISMYKSIIFSSLRAGDMSMYSEYIKKEGKETICGRTCTKYSWYLSELGDYIKGSLWLEDKYNICFKESIEYSESGKISKTSREVLEFKDTGITLPEADYEKLIVDRKAELIKSYVGEWYKQVADHYEFKEIKDGHRIKITDDYKLYFNDVEYSLECYDSYLVVRENNKIKFSVYYVASYKKDYIKIYDDHSQYFYFIK